MDAASSQMHQFPELARVREELRIEWYRCPIEPSTLRRLCERSDWRGLLQAGGHLGIFLITGALVFYCWDRGLWMGMIGALFFHGTVASFFAGIAPHELGHGTVFRTRWLNRFFLYTFSSLSWFDPFDYNVSHTYHHRYTLHPKGDGEVLLPLHPATDLWFLVQMFTINLFTQRGRTFGKGGLFRAILATIRTARGQVDQPHLPSQAWLERLHRDQPAEFRKSVWFARWLLCFHLGILLCTLATGWWVLPLLLTVPSFVGNGLSYFVGMTQHCGLRDNVPDFRKCVRSVVLDPISEFLYWHMNWHTEHHMYAAVPCYRLKELQRELAPNMPRPKSLFEAWKEMLETWRHQKLDPGYQFDIPVPPMISARKASEKDDALVVSVGDLAPKTLQSS